MANWVCPVCGGVLRQNGKAFCCENQHSFDIAKSGYVNLLGRAGEGCHGDNRLMVRARRDFLNKGYYAPLLDAVHEILRENLQKGAVILDAGCGECWYTAGLYSALAKDGLTPKLLGVDISKEAADIGARRCKELRVAVASVFALPVEAGACDAILSFFAPFSPEEFGRVLRPEGLLVRVAPLPRHLWNLKKTVYDTPYENEDETGELAGFNLILRREVRTSITLACAEDIENLFTMTPYFYKTSPKDKVKLEAFKTLETETEFAIFVYRKG